MFGSLGPLEVDQLEKQSLFRERERMQLKKFTVESINLGPFENNNVHYVLMYQSSFKKSDFPVHCAPSTLIGMKKCCATM